MDLFHRRLATTIETEEGKRMAEALVKLLTGGDPIRARRMREDFTEFFPTHKFILAANHKPEIHGTDIAIWERIKMVPFTVYIKPGERDPRLPEKLAAEAAGVLAWAVRGCRQWQDGGLRHPREVEQATARYREESDTIGRFLDEYCTLQEGRAALSAVLEAYRTWSGVKTITAQQLAAQLRRLSFEVKQSTGNRNYCYGFTLPQQLLGGDDG
jgi:putative DNA primase/helicase